MISFNNVKVDISSESETKGQFTFENLPVGYGTTLAVALRRILMNSMEGAAITAVRISEVDHEFTSIEGVKDGVYEIVLNLKQLKFDMKSGETAEATLKLSKEGVVTGKDIKLPSNIEIANPDEYITEVSKLEKDIEMKLTIEKGFGYRSINIEDRDEIGYIPLDADFSPVKRVDPTVTEMRIEGNQKADKLELVVITDGSISPREALGKTMEVAENLFTLLIDKVKVLSDVEVPEEEIDKTDSSWDISELDIGTRLENTLADAGITSLVQVTEMTEDELLDIDGLGAKSAEKLIDLLDEYGLSLKE